MRCVAFLTIFLGNSIVSMPFRIMLYVFIGSWPENGGLEINKIQVIDIIKKMAHT